MTQNIFLFSIFMLIIKPLVRKSYATKINSIVLNLQNARITQDKIIYNFDQNYANFSAVVWEHKGHSYINLSAENFVDLERMLLSFVFAIPRNDGDRNYENIMMTSTLNSCKIQQGTRGNFIIKMVMDEFERNSDFKFNCPFMKVRLMKLFKANLILFLIPISSRNLIIYSTLSQMENFFQHFCCLQPRSTILLVSSLMES